MIAQASRYVGNPIVSHRLIDSCCINLVETFLDDWGAAKRAAGDFRPYRAARAASPDLLSYGFRTLAGAGFPIVGVRRGS